METELKSLKIDRSARRQNDGNPAIKWIVIAVIVLVVLAAAAFAYKKATAAGMGSGRSMPPSP